MSKRNEVLEQNPELLEKQDIADSVELYDKLHDFKALYDTPGGKLLAKTLMQDAIGKINQLRAQYRTMTHQEMIGLISHLDVSIDTAKLLMDAEAGMEILNKEIEEALRE